MFAIPPRQSESISVCVFNACGKPLGQESKDLSYVTCHEHRTCAKCDLPLKAPEIKWCYDKYLEELRLDPDGASMDLCHPRCHSLTHSTLSDDPTLTIRQSEYDYLNLIRLMVEPSLELNEITNENNALIQSERLMQHWNKGRTLEHWDFDQIYLFLKKMEACVAQASNAVNYKDTKAIKARLNEREGRKVKLAKQEAQTSSRPVQKAPDDAYELELSHFMAFHGIKARKTAMKILKIRQNAIESLTAAPFNMPLDVAVAMVDKDKNYKALADKEDKVK